ncbi:hypothetical protein MIS24_24095, partial [Vibrio parahaemolyticus]|uniref:hypothetical protein n=1 Tax=Vibrio parahaemolyticus TaxID=670 RepID=UPI001EF8EC32
LTALFHRFQISKGYELRTLTAVSKKLSFAENFSATKTPRQRNNPKVRNRKRRKQSENFTSSATGANLKGTFDQV